MKQFSLAIIITLSFVSLFFSCKKDSSAYMEIKEDNLTNLSQPYVAEGETRKVPVSTDLKGIDVSSSEGWCSAYIENGEDGTTFLVVEVIKNEFSKERTAEIQIQGKGKDIKVPITQFGSAPSLIISEINRGGKDTLFIVDDSLQFSLHIASNTGFNLELPSWIENVGDTPSVRNYKYDFETSPIEPGKRTGVIRISVPDHPDLAIDVPVVQIQHRLVNFYPATAEKSDTVILTGRGFGTDKSQVQVYFNTKEAEVVDVTNNSISVIVPRAPGDQCIVKVVVAGDEEAYSQKFDYIESWGLYTVTGGQTGSFQGGTLEDATFTPWGICVDDNNNIFVIHHVKGDYMIVRINEAEDVVESVGTVTDEPYGLTVGANNVVFAVDGTDGGKSYFKLDPANDWVPEKHTANFSGTTPIGTFGYTIAYNAKDGYLYETNNKGEVLKINPDTDEGEVIFTNLAAPYWYAITPGVDGAYLLAMGNSGSATQGRGYGPRKMDLTNASAGFVALNTSAITPIAESEQELNDGALEDAGFGRGRGMDFGKDGLLYVSDETNSLIRVIDFSNNTVNTIIGVASDSNGSTFGDSGFIDGTKDKARLKAPGDIAWSKDGKVLYIVDAGNNSIRGWVFD